jgi:aminoglycoside 6'-N-acetyltransferase
MDPQRKELRTRLAVLRGERVLLRPGRPEDTGSLVRIRNEPEVAWRWGDEDIEEDVGEAFVGTDTGFVIEVGGEVVGAIQFHEEDDPMYRHAGMDIFLATSWHGQGLGTEAIRVLARHLFEDRGHHRLTIDPAADNVAAIRAYEKAGFRRVGVMRQYERGPDGTWHDGLLMDMLAEGLRP